MKTNRLIVLPLLFLSLGANASSAEPSKFEQDRAAILSMAGAFEVRFSFEESAPIAEGYELRKPYLEEARELVKVVEDGGERIVLQHLLVVGNDGDPRVVKHWGQVWTYEDRQILNFEAEERWVNQQRGSGEVAGTWSQLVTQTDDTPRYESFGVWRHGGGCSEWVSGETRRPLPRREYSKREDYQVLVGENRHVVSESGWLHFQLNRKRVEDGGALDLCIERGLNSYRRIATEELAAADEWWERNQGFWSAVASAWRLEVDRVSLVDLRPQGRPKSYERVFREMRKAHKNGAVPSGTALSEAIRPYVSR